MRRPPSRVLQRIAGDWLLLVLIVSFPLLFWAAPVPVEALPELVDWKTVSALAGLMVLSRALEVAGLMERAGR